MPGRPGKNRNRRNNGRQQKRRRTEVDDILDDLSDLRYEMNKATKLGAELAEYAKPGLLLKLMNNRHPMIRFGAIEAYRQGDYDITDNMIDALLSKIDDRREFIAIAAINTMGELRIDEAIDEIISCISMDDPKIAAASLNALAEFEEEPIGDFVEDFLNSEEPTRIRAAAQVIGRLELTEFSEACLQLLKDTRQDAYIEPGKNEFNPHLLAARDLIRTLGILKHEPATDTIRELALEHYGLRSFSLYALKNMGVDILEIAKEAYEKQPSTKIGRLLASIDESFEFDKPASRGGMSNHLENNKKLLEESKVEVEVGQKVSGGAVYVHRRYAIIETGEGLAAFLHAREFSWNRTPDLRDFRDKLEESNEYEITGIDLDSGKLELSRKILSSDPLADFESAFNDEPMEGKIESIARFGLFVELKDDVVGLLHISEMDVDEDFDLRDEYELGDPMTVQVKTIDLDKRRIQLSLPE